MNGMEVIVFSFISIALIISVTVVAAVALKAIITIVEDERHEDK